MYKSIFSSEIRNDGAAWNAGVLGYANEMFAVGHKDPGGMLHGQQKFTHVFVVFKRGAFLGRKTSQKINLGKLAGIDKNETSPGPCSFFAGFGYSKNRIQNRIDAKLGIQAHNFNPFVHQKISDCVCRTILENKP